MTDKDILRARRERLQREDAGPVARDSLEVAKAANRIALAAAWGSVLSAAIALLALLISLDVI